MDEDDDYVGEDESSTEGSIASDVERDTHQHAARDETLQLSPSKHDGAYRYQTAKWLRLKKHYNDRYLELFNTTHSESLPDDNLEDSQIGSIRWTGLEKGELFTAIQRKGRHDLAGLAAAVQTKSAVEIKDYLDRLKNAELERQMFAPRTKNVSQAEVEAAVEIGEGCEAMLDNAADALAAYQECFDQVSAHHQTNNLRLIGAEEAEQLDSLSDAVDAGQLDDEVQDMHPGARPECRLFHLSKFLELSRRLFMNMPSNSEHAHWTELAIGGESPAIASDAIEMFYNLIVSIVRRVLQTAIFLTESRIRAMHAADQDPARVLKEMDVEAALQVLNMPPHGFDYWVGWVKRSKVTVVSGTQTKGQSDRRALSLQQIENILSVRSTRNRSQSLSSLVSMTSSEGSTAEDNESGQESPAGTDEELQQSSSNTDKSSPTDLSMELNSTDIEPSEVEDPAYQDDLNGPNTTSQLADHHHPSRKRRYELLDNEEDEYMERLDQANRHHQEAHLYQFLGQSMIKAESPESSGQRPGIQRRRKTKDDLHDWSDMHYCAPWEHPTLSDREDDGSKK